MKIGLRLDEAIERCLSGGPATLERIGGLLPVVESHLRVTRPIDRFAQLELRLSGPRRRPEPGPPQKPR